MRDRLWRRDALRFLAMPTIGAEANPRATAATEGAAAGSKGQAAVLGTSGPQNPCHALMADFVTLRLHRLRNAKDPPIEIAPEF